MKKIDKQLNLLIKLYRKSSPDNLIDKNDYESLCDIFTKYLEGTKNEFFLNMSEELKLNNISIIKLKFNLEPRS